MTRTLAAASLALALLTIGCAGKGGPTGVDGDAALGERGPRATDSTAGDAPSVETNRDDRINSPVAR